MGAEAEAARAGAAGAAGAGGGVCAAASGASRAAIRPIAGQRARWVSIAKQPAMMPTTMPSTCSRVSFSMRKASPAMSAVMMGVVALKMLATPDDTYCCAHAKS